jgi:hypothetical protein
MENTIAQEFLKACDGDIVKLVSASRKIVYRADASDPNLHSKLLLVPEYQSYWQENKPKEKTPNHVLKDFAMAATQIDRGSEGLHCYLDLAENIINWYRHGSGEYYDVEKDTSSSGIKVPPSTSTPSKEKLKKPINIQRGLKSVSPSSDSGAGNSSNKASPSPKSNSDDDEVEDVDENNWTSVRGSVGSQSYKSASGYLVEPLRRTRTGGKGTKRGRQTQYLRSDDDEEFPEA